MKKIILIIAFLAKATISLLAQHQALVKDWLVGSIPQKSQVNITNSEIVLDNGLVRRSFFLGENLACYDYFNQSTQQQLIRSVKPEARVTINGKIYQVGGLQGQKENAYLKKEWLKDLKKGTSDFVYQSFEVKPVEPFVNWKANTWVPNTKRLEGKRLKLSFVPQDQGLQGIKVQVNYEIYDNIPLIIKWVEIENQTGKTIYVDRVVNEILGLVEEESAVVGSPTQMKKQHGIYFETNYAFNNAMRYDISDQTTHWLTDSTYTSQVNYNYETPCLFEVYPEKVSHIKIVHGESFKSVRTHELLMDSYDRQRRGMMIRKMYRTIAPWTTQNPIFMHLVSQNDEQVINCINQCASTGYEALILSFGSHLNMEDVSETNLTRWKKLADYAHSKGILLGGYSLFSSRRIDDENDVVDPVTGKTGHAFFGNAPCFGSKWGLNYRDKIKQFFEVTHFDIWENDGPYPGDVCASTQHPGHEGLADSQWKQMNIQKELYRWLNERGVYINAPDWYFLDGTHKIALGYREVNFSLSREQQRILNRQNIHDGTIEKTSAMSWGFVPLTKYQGGDESAILEPLNEHLSDYEQLMMIYYGAGVQACYRGPRLYDTDATKAVVQKTISWYKKYRDILNADMIQLRRADGRDWDGLLHVSSTLLQKGLAMLYNPNKEDIERTITLPLYYSGLTKEAKVREKEGSSKVYLLNQNHEIQVKVKIPAEGYTWLVIE
ncbi:alpha-galactosidase [Cellulophaga sp. BC115SP]|uniref:alpha-galactosidase n=1 Tax=Cellulophaga sp. BC115SP TaxID=2683263 RepID=UPI0014130734|nr:alpha-galactosidase [Cellulophaga sp. BC115SP]NBB30907.1 alpha-galactosidase [Cellulophaga sp. BC115SP]